MSLALTAAPLPWQIEAWGMVTSQKEFQALLITGPQGIGKAHFARTLTQHILCTSLQKKTDANSCVCCKCVSCQLIQAESHPDIRILEPQPPKASEGEETATNLSIRIEEIRELYDFVNIGSHQGNGKIILIFDAHLMNAIAQNALLKMLEDSPEDVRFILVSHRPTSLLATIRSRCLLLTLKKPSVSVALDWLQAQAQRENTTGEKNYLKSSKTEMENMLRFLGSAPLRVQAEQVSRRSKRFSELIQQCLDPRENILQLAANWESAIKTQNDQGLSPAEIVDTLQKVLFDLLLTQVSGRTRFTAIADEAFQARANLLRKKDLFNKMNNLIKLRKLAHHPLNKRLFMESLAILRP